MEPYFDDGQVTLYHGDAREILPRLAADVLITDPPYGIELGSGTDRRTYERGDHKHGLTRPAYRTHEDTYENYLSVVCPVITEAITMTKRAAVFTGPNLWDLPRASAIGGIYCPTAAARTPWGFKSFLPVLLYGKHPALAKGSKPTVLNSNAHAEPNGHPCPKPLPWMRWVVGLAALPGETVLDPFAGSGTTLVAAREVGCKAIGIEVDERYCEIAARRLSQPVLMAPETPAAAPVHEVLAFDLGGDGTAA